MQNAAVRGRTAGTRGEEEEASGVKAGGTTLAVITARWAERVDSLAPPPFPPPP